MLALYDIRDKDAIRRSLAPAEYPRQQTNQLPE